MGIGITGSIGEMKDRDFKDFGIAIDAHLIKSTNAPLDTVNLYTVIKLDESMAAVSSEFGCTLVVLPDGITTGVHRTPWHARGLAVDVAIDGDKVPIYKILKRMISIGWKGIGVYHNGQSYRLHLDMRPALSIWGGVRNDSEWINYNLFRDPADPAVRQWVTDNYRCRKQKVRPMHKAGVVVAAIG